MKSVTIVFASLGLGLAACSAAKNSGIDPADAHPDAGRENAARRVCRSGVLAAFTPLIRVDQDGRPVEFPDGSDSDAFYLVPTGYAIYDRDGRLVADVPHQPSGVEEEEGPTGVSLPPGRYLIRLEQPDQSVRSFWVSIETRRLTELEPPGRSQSELREVRAGP
jgi:hypothetical protein